jgi:tetratricopeptide (TPR) repeat protein
LWWQYSDPRDTRRWIVPHLAAELSSEDYRTNHDPAMKAILNYVPQKGLVDSMLDALLAYGLDTAVKRYRDFKADPVNKYANTETQLSRLGWRLLGMNRLDQAIEVFKINVGENPRSSNVYDDLGEAYARKGEKALAIKSLEKSIELNPTNWNTVDKLKALRKSESRLKEP